MPTRVKICGITSENDAWQAVEAGADALGFMFYRPSPRWIGPEAVRRIVETLPPFVARVGVFVDTDEAELRRAVEECGLDTLQLHGNESPELCRRLRPVAVLKAFRVKGPEAVAEWPAYAGIPWLLDSYVAGSMGGTGQTFNWDLAAGAVARGAQVVLAGGLTPENVAAAVAAVRPWGVDVSSGVEAAPGRKDAAKVRAFIHAAKAEPRG